MAKAKKSQPEKFEFRAEMKQLLHLIVHSLYTHPEIFLRELISNSSDALNKIRFRGLTDKNILDPNADLKITITLDEKKNQFSIEDTGIGMTKDELINEIGTVAHSGTLEFLQKLSKEKKPLDGQLIGQFGVGFYSVFMVTDEVTIETRYAEADSKGYRWTSKGEGTFSIEEIDRKQRGTKILFTLKEEAKEFAEEYRIKDVIRKYSNFVDFPIYVDKEQVNRVTALWQKQKSELKKEELDEFYKFLSNDFQPPAGFMHFNIEGAVNFKSLIFIPDTAPPTFFREDLEKTVHLYSNKIFIQDNAKELLPEYLRFVKGVVDTEDLPLNVSREWVQNSPVIAKIKNTLVSKILGFLEEWSKTEPEKFKKFHQNFGPLFKTGINTDFTNRDKIIDLLRFESTVTEKDQFTSLKNYVSRMKDNQKEIYYLTGENMDIIKRSPNLEYFREKDIEVLLLTDPVDIFIIPSIPEYDKKPLKSIEKADIDMDVDDKNREEALNENLSKSLIDVFKETLGDKVEDVIESKRLVDSPATLVSGKEALDSSMERMMKYMDKDFTGSKKILEINTRHPLIKNLSRINMVDSKSTILRDCIVQLYEGIQVLNQNLESPGEFIKRMTEIMVKATEK
ncbi:MAG: molecular chaperone HtpG [bacterium]|nr:MAG: molecular chaperone HtpG [bacterium]